MYDNQATTSGLTRTSLPSSFQTREARSIFSERQKCSALSALIVQDRTIESKVLHLLYCQRARSHAGGSATILWRTDDIPRHFDGVRPRCQVRHVEIEAMSRERAKHKCET